MRISLVFKEIFPILILKLFAKIENNGHTIEVKLKNQKNTLKFNGKTYTLEQFHKDLDYYNFEGSLTTPPCTEGVNWIVFKKQENISKAQVKKFSKTLGFNNNRPIQKLNGREIKE